MDYFTKDIMDGFYVVVDRIEGDYVVCYLENPDAETDKETYGLNGNPIEILGNMIIADTLREGDVLNVREIKGPKKMRVFYLDKEHTQEYRAKAEAQLERIKRRQREKRGDA
ncbi:DUF3006 domain-containing protein [Oscillospiraceae bacterium OttesenSCG-928-F05]|nr:DUF3006 domain-containing protein [Oscillospiraceae bacterium OttesenSCG-928-F05]